MSVKTGVTTNWKYIEDIVTPSSEKEETPNCMKRVWSYIKHKKSDGNNIPPLKSDGLLHEDSTDKANILNQQFKDTFSNKDEFTLTQYKQRCKMTGNFET